MPAARPISFVQHSQQMRGCFIYPPITTIDSVGGFPNDCMRYSESSMLIVPRPVLGGEGEGTYILICTYICGDVFCG